MLTENHLLEVTKGEPDYKEDNISVGENINNQINLEALSGKELDELYVKLRMDQYA